MAPTAWQEGWKLKEDSNGDKFGEFMEKVDSDNARLVENSVTEQFIGMMQQWTCHSDVLSTSMLEYLPQKHVGFDFFVQFEGQSIATSWLQLKK